MPSTTGRELFLARRAAPLSLPIEAAPRGCCCALDSLRVVNYFAAAAAAAAADTESHRHLAIPLPLPLTFAGCRNRCVAHAFLLAVFAILA